MAIVLNNTANAYFYIPELWWIFGNQRVEVTGVENTKVFLTMNGITETREIVGGKAEFSLSPFYRTVFNAKYPNFNQQYTTGDHMTLNTSGIQQVSVGEVGTAPAQGNIPCIYAGMLPWVKVANEWLEEWTVWNPNYPWDATFIDDITGENVHISVDGSADFSKTFTVSDTVGFRADMAQILYGTSWGTSDVAERVRVKYHETFTQNGLDADKQRRALNIMVDTSDCGGRYLRWLDSSGRTHYRLFKEADITQTTRSENSYSLGQSATYQSPALWSHGMGRYRGTMTEQRSIGLVLVCQPKKLMPELMTLLASDFVDLYDETNQTWTRVEVEDGQVTDNGKHLQDFSLRITVPSREIPVR